MIVVAKEERWIDHRLNLLGIRVWRDKCQLIAKVEKEWIPFGPSRNLPLKVPKDADDLISADPLMVTAYQYMAENPNPDLEALLSKEKDFVSVLDSY